MNIERFNGVLLSTLVMASIIALAIPLLSSGSVHAALTPHDPIYIEGNGNFTPANGVVGGTGAENDPYILENWVIEPLTYTGIRIHNTTAHFVVRNCLIENGTYHEGIYLYNVVNGRIENNTCSNNYDGILLSVSDNNILVNNTCESNDWYGISIASSDNNTLDNNTMENNRYNFGVSGSSLLHFTHDIDTSNLVNGRPIRYLVDNHDEVIGPSLSIGYLALVRCDNIVVENLVLENNGQGILLAFTENSRIENCVCSNNSGGIYIYYSSNNTLDNNTCENNDYRGIRLYGSSNNTLTNNTCENNYRCGIRLFYSPNNTLDNNTCENNQYGIYLCYSSDNNTLFHNYLLNNTENNAYDNCTNNWDNGSEGNYWSDWQPPEHPDANDDGIVDNARPILGDNNWDNFPLVIERVPPPPWNWYVKTPGYGSMSGNCWENAMGTIENAIAHASAGDNIIVGDGTYPENLNVNKSLTIRSENGAAVTIVQTPNLNDHVFEVMADNVSIIGLTVENAGIGKAGIFLSGSDNCDISNNTCENNFSRGIYLYFSSYNTLSNNTCENNYAGISLSNSSNNTLTNNTCENNSYGIYPHFSSNNNTFSNNTCENNFRGIYLALSSNNTLSNNTCENNDYGIHLESSSNNIIYHNNFVNNATQAYDSSSNYWDNGYPSGGNYWSDYTGVDENHGKNQDIPGGEGIGDTPYDISGGGSQDHYPLMNPWPCSIENYFDLHLVAGWNLISVPVTSDNTTPGNLFSGIEHYVWYFDVIWKTLQDFQTFELGVGYWIWLKSATTVTVPIP